jgi:hypothetical protein
MGREELLLCRVSARVFATQKTTVWTRYNKLNSVWQNVGSKFLAAATDSYRLLLGPRYHSLGTLHCATSSVPCSGAPVPIADVYRELGDTFSVRRTLRRL